MFEKLGKEIEALPIYQFVGFACHCWSRASWNEKDMLPAILAFWQNFLLWLVTTYHYTMTSMSFYFLYTLAYMVKTFFLYLLVLIGNVWQFSLQPFWTTCRRLLIVFQSLSQKLSLRWCAQHWVLRCHTSWAGIRCWRTIQLPQLAASPGWSVHTRILNGKGETSF